MELGWRDRLMGSISWGYLFLRENYYRLIPGEQTKAA